VGVLAGADVAVPAVPWNRGRVSLGALAMGARRRAVFGEVVSERWTNSPNDVLIVEQPRLPVACVLVAWGGGAGRPSRALDTKTVSVE